MNNDMIAVMIGVSICLGLTGLLAFIWGLKTGQFDDEKKMMQGVLYDDIEDLRSIAELEKKEKAKKTEQEEKDGK